MKSTNYDVIIIGGGITGTSLAYVLSNFTNIKKIALLEKYSQLSQVNSQRNNNSQTLHFGDIETNYSLEKAAKVKEAAEMVAKYITTIGKNEKLYHKTHKMVLAVGAEEIAQLEQRYEEFKQLFPKFKKIGRKEIAILEPNIVKDRDDRENILALCTEDGYAVDYGKLSESFVSHATGSFNLFLNTKINKLNKTKNGYEIATNNGLFEASVVVVCAGSHSLIFAQSLGYGKDFGLLPVAGSFYTSSKALNGKVYTLQIKKLPFAAIHGDPDVAQPEQTRFGPTAKVLPLLERHRYNTISDFLKTSAFTLGGVLSLLKIVSDPIIFRYLIRNLMYDLPFIGKLFFLQEVKKIIPSMKASQIHLEKKIGGIRPQIVDTTKRQMNMGEAKIVGDNIIFNITPSPGASVCLKNAENDTRKVIAFFNENYSFDKYSFNEKKFDKMFR
ncbi:FAD-dependent oxidoreductase [Candidatus Woesearchaeota archaeon]|nr:FAD-dependent oxidoreductase [Candidatus Woesearchaeota archaeon]